MRGETDVVVGPHDHPIWWTEVDGYGHTLSGDESIDQIAAESTGRPERAPICEKHRRRT